MKNGDNVYVNNINPDSKIVKVLSIDPGTTITGWAMSTFNIPNNTYTVHKFGMITPTKLAKKDKEDCLRYTQQLIALDHLAIKFDELMISWKPNFVVSEDVFMNAKFANAHAALTLCLFVMSNLCRKKYHMPFYKLAPCHVKRIVTSSGTANKVSIQEAIINNPEIIVNTKLMTEHEADAIGVGYTFSKQIPMILASL